MSEPITRRDFLKAAGLAIGCAFAAPKSIHALSIQGANPDDYFGMLYDATICVGCNACTNACRQENNTAPETDARELYDAPKELSSHTWTLIQLYEENEEFSFVKRQCMHCVDPACVGGCPVHALVKDENGAVTYDADRCIGCRYCMYTCPFHVPRFQWEERIPVVAKCTLCNGTRLSKGQFSTACAERCPTGALTFGKRGDLIAEAEGRIQAEPHRYVDHIYGKEDLGGTGVLYLSGVPFEKLGLEDMGTEPAPKLSEDTANVVLPTILIGGTIGLAAVRYLSHRGAWEDTWPV